MFLSVPVLIGEIVDQLTELLNRYHPEHYGIDASPHDMTSVIELETDPSRCGKYGAIGKRED
tara:strand:+ start:84 stop:269 length:186 start_codon:yes stop_codon:yes gene_type:complete